MVADRLPPEPVEQPGHLVLGQLDLIAAEGNRVSPRPTAATSSRRTTCGGCGTTRSVCNIGHFDDEIDMAGPEAMRRRGEVERVEIKRRVHEWRFKETRHSVIVLAEGRMVNLACATGHPSFVRFSRCTGQVPLKADRAASRDPSRRGRAFPARVKPRRSGTRRASRSS